MTQWRDFEHSKEWRQILKLTEYICTTKHTYTMIIIMICKRKQDRGNKWYHTSVLAFSFFFLSRGKFIVQWQSINLRCLWNMIPIWTTLNTIYHSMYILEIVLKTWNKTEFVCLSKLIVVHMNLRQYKIRENYKTPLYWN